MLDFLEIFSIIYIDIKEGDCFYMRIKKVTRDYFETENGEKIEHQFELDEIPSVEEFQQFYDEWERNIKSKINIEGDDDK